MKGISVAAFIAFVVTFRLAGWDPPPSGPHRSPPPRGLERPRNGPDWEKAFYDRLYAPYAGEERAEAIAGLREEVLALPSEIGFTNVRGRGLFCAFDLPDTETRNKVRAEVYKQGLVISGSGSQSLRFRPPLVITPEQVDEGVGMIRKALAGLKG